MRSVLRFARFLLFSRSPLDKGGLRGVAVGLLLAGFAFVPSAVFAQQSSADVQARYGNQADCKSGPVEPKGTFLYPSGIEKDTLNLIVDPDFNAKMKRERFTPDLPVTPIYDLMVEAVPTFSACYTDTPEKFSTEPPKTLPFPVSIKLGNEILVGPETLEYRGKKGTDGRLLYEWEVPGWMDGIAKGEKLEKLIKAIQEQKSVKIVVDTLKQSDGTIGKEETEASLGLCAPIWGSGTHRLIGSYAGTGGTDIIPLSERVSHFDKVRTDGFQRINPMALPKYKGYFSYFVDLKPVTAEELHPLLAILAVRMKNRPPAKPAPYTLDVHNKALLSIIGDSTCGNTGTVFTTVNKSYNSGVAMLSGKADRKGTVIGGNRPPRTYVHEWGHTFAGLNDEYTYDPHYEGERVTNVPLYLTNCALNPYSHYAYNDRLYGGVNYKGCSYDAIASGTLIRRELQSFYRPAFASIMGGPVKVEERPEMFNVVSCGWIIAAIKSGNANSYFPECATMEGIIKDGVGKTASALFPVFARIGNMFNPPSTQLAAVAASGSAAKGNEYVIVESFANGDPQGEIRIVTDEQPATVPDLGAYYGDKLKKLKESINRALEVQKKKKSNAQAGEKGGEIQQGDPKIDGPLYLLQKMQKELETKSDGSLKDGQGLSKFFAHLRALKAYNDPAFGDVIQSAEEFTGFSYLFPFSPPSPDKPLLIFIPPTGEPTAWSTFLGEHNANAIGYVYDNTASAEEMMATLLEKLKSAGLDKQGSVMVAYSFGNTVLLRTVEQAIAQGDKSFAHTAFVSLGFLPGGASDFLGFLGKLTFIRSVGRFLYPPSNGIFEMLPPDSSPQGPQNRLVNNLGRINQETLGVSYVQSMPEGEYHIDRNNTHRFYAPTVKQFFSEVEAANKITYVSENHWNLPDAAATKDVIEKSLAIVSPRKPKSSLDSFLAFQPAFVHDFAVKPFFKLLATAIAASPAPKTEPDRGLLQIIPALFGGTLDECRVLTDALAESMLQIPGTDAAATEGAIKEYLAETKLSCTFEKLEQDARARLAAEKEFTTTEFPDDYEGKEAESETITKEPVTPTIPAGAKVKVFVPENQKPPAEFAPLAAGETTAKPEQCLDASGKRTFSDDPKPFRANWDKQAKCAQTIADATALSRRIADIDAALAGTRRFLDALRATEATFKAAPLEPRKGGTLSLVAVPIGGFDGELQVTANSVAMQCVKRGATSLLPSVPVGVAGVERSFTAITGGQVGKLTSVRKEIRDAYGIIQKPLAEGKNIGPIDTLRFAGAFNKLFKEMKDEFLIMTPGAYRAHVAAGVSQANTIPLSITFTPREKCSFPSLPGVMRFFDAAEKDEPFATATVTLGDYSVPRFCLPERSFSEALEKGVPAYRKTFTSGEFMSFDKETKEYLPDKKRAKETFGLAEQTLLIKKRELERQLQALETAKYSCDASIPTVSYFDKEPYEGHAAASGGIGAGVGGSLQSLTEAVKKIAETKKTQLASGSPDPVLSALVAERKREALALMRRNPAAFLASLVPKETRALLPQSLRDSVEDETTLTGTLEIAHTDDFKSPNNSSYRYYLRNVSAETGRPVPKSAIPGSDERLELFPTEPIAAVSGARLRVRGYRIENVMAPGFGKTSVTALAAAPSAPARGEQRLLVLLIKTKGAPELFTPDYVRKRIFEGPFQKFYQEQSYGELRFAGEVHGWLPLDRPEPDSTKGEVMKPPNFDDDNAFLSRSLRERAIDLSRFDHIILISSFTGLVENSSGMVGKTELTADGQTHSLGLINLNFNPQGGPSQTLALSFDFTSFDYGLIHEVGHALGLFHSNGLHCDFADSFSDSCRHREYGDRFDAMGGSNLALHFNAASKDKLGWLRGDKLLTINTTGRYTLAPFEADAGARAAKVVHDSASKESPLYIENRRARGFDLGLGRFTDTRKNEEGLFIHFPITPLFSDRLGSYLVDASPTKGSDWMDDVFTSALLPPAVFADTARGVILGPVVERTADSISFDVGIGKPRCVERTAKLAPLASPGLVNAGTSGRFDFSLTNRDSSLCDDTDFSFAASGLPQSWQALFSKNKGELAVGETLYSGLTVSVPSATAAGAYRYSLAAHRESGKESRMDLSFFVLPPLTVGRVTPATAKVGDTITIEGTGFLGGGGKTAVLLIGSKGESRRFELVSPDGKTLRLTVPSSLALPCDKAPCPTVPVAPGSYSLVVRTPSALAETSLIIAPDLSQGTPLTSCGEITKSGKYLLIGNITDTSADLTEECIDIHDVKQVELDCANHTITGDLPVAITNAEQFSLTRCKLDSKAGTGIAPLYIRVSKNGEISGNTFGPRGAVFAERSSGLLILRNTFNAAYQQVDTSQSRIEGNTFTLSFLALQNAPVSSVGGALSLLRGSLNRVANNTIDGGAEGLLSRPIGADDGIVLDGETNTTVSANRIANVWDCGIETVGEISGATIQNNMIKNAGLCGIGGWHQSSWKGNTVSENTIEDAPKLFVFRRDSGIRKEGEKIHFSDNIFARNKLVAPRAKGGVALDHSASFSFAPGSVQPGDARAAKEDDFVLGGNTFADNDFTSALFAPKLIPERLALDGGGNICGKALTSSADAKYPLACAQAGAVNLNAQVIPIVVSGMPFGGAGSFLAGEMRLEGSVVNESDTDIRETFQGVFEYSLSGGTDSWRPWVHVTFSGLAARTRAEAKYTWTGAGGGRPWYFRFRADPGNVISEVSENDNYSASAPITIVSVKEVRPQPPAGAVPNLVPEEPTISGDEVAPGTLKAGIMKLTAKITNDGKAPSASFDVQLLYSQDGIGWSDWVQIPVASLGPGETSSVDYTWRGERGGRWHFKICVNDAPCSDAVSVDII